MPPGVSTGDRDSVLRQIRWCSAVHSIHGKNGNGKKGNGKKATEDWATGKLGNGKIQQRKIRG